MTGPAVPPSGEEPREVAELLYPGLFPDEAYRRHPAQIDRVAAAVRDALAAQEVVKRVEALAEELQGTAEVTGGKVNGFVFAARLRDLLGIEEEA